MVSRLLLLLRSSGEEEKEISYVDKQECRDYTVFIIRKSMPWVKLL